MAKLSYKISSYALYLMILIILVVLALFFCGGDAEGSARLTGVDPEMWQPANTDALLYLVYALFAVAIIATLAAAVVQFVSTLKDSPAKALSSLLGLVVLIVLLVVTWALGSDKPLNIPGYDGTDNVPFWLKLTDMFIYTLYILLGVNILLMIVSGVKKKIS